MKKDFALIGVVLFDYPNPPDDLYEPMKNLFLEMGYKITIEASRPDAIFGVMEYKGPHLIGEKDQFKIAIVFKQIEIKTQIKIYVSQTNPRMNIGELDKIRNEIAEKFKEKMGHAS